MTQSNTPTLAVRESRTNPGKFVVCHDNTGTAVLHPRARVADAYGTGSDNWVTRSLFDAEDAARAAAAEWPAIAEDVERTAPRAPRPVSSQLPPAPRTLADEVRALKRYMAARDADPFGYPPLSVETGMIGGW